jgi:hypothetical protein
MAAVHGHFVGGDLMGEDYAVMRLEIKKSNK